VGGWRKKEPWRSGAGGRADLGRVQRKQLVGVDDDEDVIDSRLARGKEGGQEGLMVSQLKKRTRGTGRVGERVYVWEAKAAYVCVCSVVRENSRDGVVKVNCDVTVSSVEIELRGAHDQEQPECADDEVRQDRVAALSAVKSAGRQCVRWLCVCLPGRLRPMDIDRLLLSLALSSSVFLISFSQKVPLSLYQRHLKRLLRTRRAFVVAAHVDALVAVALLQGVDNAVLGQLRKIGEVLRRRHRAASGRGRRWAQCGRWPRTKESRKRGVCVCVCVRACV